MSKKQLLFLFIGALIPWTIAAGFMPLIPIYVLQFGVSQALTGYYVAFEFGIFAIGTFFAGWLADRFQHRKVMFIVYGLVMCPLWWLMGQADSFWQFAAVHSVVSFLFGAEVAQISILTGLFAGREERGRILGIIGMTAGLGAIIGGFTIGPIVDRWGYAVMFSIFSFANLIPPISGIFLKDRKVERTVNEAEVGRKKKSNFGTAFIILLSAHLIAFTVYGIGNMARSIGMKNLEFTAASITSTVTIAGFISLPFPFFLGWLSDRFGRKRLMIICYSSLVICMVLFAFSKSLWHFWIAACLLRISLVSKDVGAAYVADLIRPEALGRGMSLFQGTFSIGQMFGYAVAGVALESLGMASASLISAAICLASVVLVFLIKAKKKGAAIIE